MPIYEYECEYCGEFEKILPIPGEDELDCPKCGRKAKRILSIVNIAHITSGFREPGVLAAGGKEIDLKKQDIFGRYFEDLPDHYEKERYFHRWKDKFEKKYGQKPPVTLEREAIADAYRGIDISKRI